jgi:hypothetical protein
MVALGGLYKQEVSMKHLPVCLMVILPFGLLIAACGPSPEEIATMTAAAWTPTPVPTETPVPPTATPTATPVPIDLTAKILDEQGNPVAGASIIFPQSGNGDPVSADDQGQFAWTDLAGPDGTLGVSAQGYFSAEQTLSLERGPNEVAVTLKRDPYGVLPAEACAPGEKLLYAEDFQDGKADGWEEITYQTSGWGIAEYLDEPGNTVVTMSGTSHTGSKLQDHTFDQAVWRTRFRVDGQRGLSFNWLHTGGYQVDGQQVDDSRYQIIIDSSGSAGRRITLPVKNLGITNGRGAKANVWHTLEVSTYQGRTEVWLDGAKLLGFTDPQPLPAGSIGLELFEPGDPTTVVYFDNLVVCELSAPFVTMPISAP